MIQHSLTISYTEFLLEELPFGDRELIDASCTALKGSHSNYSGFAVGAALRLQSGVVVTGSNQENASSPCGICAERTALFYAGAQYPEERITDIAIAAANDEQPISPCGLCRQALLEVEQRQGAPIRLLLSSRERVYVIERVADLLPIGFIHTNKDIKAD